MEGRTDGTYNISDFLFEKCRYEKLFYEKLMVLGNNCYILVLGMGPNSGPNPKAENPPSYNFWSQVAYIYELPMWHAST